MTVSKRHGRQRGLFLFGLGLVGLGGWLVVRLAMIIAVGMLGQNGPVFNGETPWRLGGGLMLVFIGFAAMTYSSACADNWTIDFEAVNTAQGNDVVLSEPRPEQTDDTHGPPRPHIVFRCSNCRTLNEQTHSLCIHCGTVL